MTHSSRRNALTRVTVPSDPPALASCIASVFSFPVKGDPLDMWRFLINHSNLYSDRNIHPFTSEICFKVIDHTLHTMQTWTIHCFLFFLKVITSDSRAHTTLHIIPNSSVMRYSYCWETDVCQCPQVTWNIQTEQKYRSTEPLHCKRYHLHEHHYSSLLDWSTFSMWKVLIKGDMVGLIDTLMSDTISVAYCRILQAKVMINSFNYFMLTKNQTHSIMVYQVVFYTKSCQKVSNCRINLTIPETLKKFRHYQS